LTADYPVSLALEQASAHVAFEQGIGNAAFLCNVKYRRSRKRLVSHEVGLDGYQGYYIVVN
jgi:hypothetical protein